MRWHAVRLLVLAVVIVRLDAVAVADDADVLKKQKEVALANWKSLYEDDVQPATEETAHLLIYGPASMTQKQLKDVGTGLEARYKLARGCLKVGPKENLWPGKLTVYLVAERRLFSTFMRTIAKQRPSADDSGVFSLAGAQPFVGACPPQTKYDPSLENQAGEQLAAAVLSQRGGGALPDWLRAGFGRATSWRAAPNAHFNDRNAVKRLASGRSVNDVWDGKLNAEEAPLLRASLVEFLAYGPGAETFPKFVEAFKPAPNSQPKTVADALKAVRYEPDRLNNRWHSWVATGR
jgi:hypothetical protein